MTKPIKQRGPSDCWPTCLAMALGITHSAVKRQIGRAGWKKLQGRGIDHQGEKALLAKFGLVYEHDYWMFYPSFHLVQTRFLRHLLRGRRAIITVTSKNNRDGMHAVYWDDKELFDPSPRKTYTWDEVEADGLLIFNEVAR